MPKQNEHDFDINAYKRFLTSLQNRITSGKDFGKHPDKSREKEKEKEKEKLIMPESSTSTSSKKNSRKRQNPFNELNYPLRKKQKVSRAVAASDESECESNDNNESRSSQPVYANIITTRSGKQIKVPSQVSTSRPSAKKGLHERHGKLETKDNDTYMELKSPKEGAGKGAPIGGTNTKGGNGNSSNGNAISKPPAAGNSSSKKNRISVKRPNKFTNVKKFLKKSFHVPPPDSSTSDEENDYDGQDMDESKISGSDASSRTRDDNETVSGSESSSDHDNVRGNRVSKRKPSPSERKQAANQLKKMLANKMNIIITMDNPDKALSSSKKSKNKHKNGTSKRNSGKPEEWLYTEDDENDGQNEYEEYENNSDTGDEYTDDGSEEEHNPDYDESDDESDEYDDEEDEDDDDEDDDEDDDYEDDEYEDDDEDEDEYDDRENEDERAHKSASLSRNASLNSLFSANGQANGSSGTKDLSFASDPDFIKFVQHTPISVIRNSKSPENDEKTMDLLFSNIKDMYKSDPDNQILRAYYYQLKNASTHMKKTRAKRLMKEKKKNCKEFKKLLKKRNSNNDLLYFKKKLTPEQQITLIQEIKEVNKISFNDVPYRLSVLQASIPRLFKSIAINKISTLRNMDPGSGEFYKIKNWVDGFMKIPFDKEKQLPVTLETHGREECSKFMDRAKKQLDEAVYGLDDAKLQLMQLVGQWIANPLAIGTAVAIHGPPGTGKTSLIKDGVSKILGRDFAFIALGGATDSSFLEGHSYTYEGSTWGRIVDILIQCKSTNPVIYFDELDKISETPKGDEIVGILTHLTDTTQNSQFHDKYFSEITFDLSKCLFIFSYNDESRVNRVLLDRMFRIRTSGYSAKEKITITQNYLIPKIIEQVKFSAGDICISPEIVEYIVENYTEKEDGVRNLKRCLEIIHTKLNLHRLMTPGTIVSMFPKEFKSNEVTFPFSVTRDNLEHLLKKNEVKLCYGMYV